MFSRVTVLCALTVASCSQQLQTFIGGEEWKQTDSLTIGLLDGLLIINEIMKKLFLLYGEISGSKSAICLCT